jgi:hypothetical protein
MARPLRVEFPAAVCHVTSRGNAQTDIFLDAADRLAFLDILAEVVQRYGWRRQRHLPRPGLAEISGAGPDGTPSPRDQAIAKACLRHRCSQSEVERHLRLPHSTVSEVLERRHSRFKV